MMYKPSTEWLFDIYCKAILLPTDLVVALLTVLVSYSHVWYRLRLYNIFAPFDEPNGPDENEYDECKTDHGTNDNTGNHPF